MKKTILVTGGMGVGKTTFCKRIMTHNPFHFPRPIHYISVDHLAKKIRNHYCNITHSQWKYLLFLHPHKKKYWHRLEHLVHPKISKTLEIILENHTTGTLLIDMALLHLLPPQSCFDRIFFLSPQPFFLIFHTLIRARNMPSYQIIALLKRQKTIFGANNLKDFCRLH